MALRKVKKTFQIDSADRDTTKYPTNGDYVVYLPRIYNNVTSLRLKGGEFANLNSTTRKHYYTSGSTLTNDAPLDFNTYYFLMELEGLNKCDETRVGGDKSAFVDKYFAKIPATINTNGIQAYNDKNLQENIAYYTPANENLDRLHIKTRTHAQQDGSGFIYFPTDYNLTFEIEYMDNSLEDDVKDDKN